MTYKWLELIFALRKLSIGLWCVNRVFLFLSLSLVLLPTTKQPPPHTHTHLNKWIGGIFCMANYHNFHIGFTWMTLYLIGLRLEHVETSVSNIIFNKLTFSSSTLPAHSQQNGPAAWHVEAGLLAPSRCVLERHGTAGGLGSTTTSGPPHISAPSTGLCRLTLRIREVQHPWFLFSE